MAEGKDIPIHIKTATDPTGLNQAVDGLQKVQAAAEGAAAGSTGVDALDEALARLEASADAALARIDALDESAGDAGETMKETAKSAGDMDENVSQISRVQKAQAIADLASAVGKIGERFRATANEVRQYDSAAADALEETANNIEKTSGAVTQLALGFAVGGPLGAGIAALGVAATGLMDAFQEAEVAAIKAGAAQTKAMQDAEAATREAAEQAERRAQELRSAEIESAIQRQNEALAEGLEILDKQLESVRKKRRENEEILRAQDDLDMANIERDEASDAISGDEAKKRKAAVSDRAKRRADGYRKTEAMEDALMAEEQARIKAETAATIERKAADARALAEEQKAEVERAQQRAQRAKLEKAALDAILAAQQGRENLLTLPYQQAKLDEARDNARIALKKFDPSNNSISLRDKTAETESAARDAQATAEKLAQDAERQRAAAEAARKEAERAQRDAEAKRAQSQDTVSVVDRKSSIEEQARKAREEAASKRQEQAAARNADNEARDAERDRERRSSAEAGIGRSAVELLPKGVRDEFRNAVTKAAQGLQDGDQGGEVKELVALMERLAAATQVRGTKTAVDIANLENRIKQLEKQK
jgi:hypothetical protein